MTEPATDHSQPSPAELPAALAEYADRLLLGTGLDAEAALEIARGTREVPAELRGLAEALTAGWKLAEEGRR